MLTQAHCKAMNRPKEKTDVEKRVIVEYMDKYMMRLLVVGGV